jgi:hypothetical protein
MNNIRTFLFLSLLVFGYAGSVARAQDEPRAAWQVASFDITANPDANGRALMARARLNARNVGRGPGSSITVRINSKAEIKSVSVNDAAATFNAQPEARGNLQRLIIRIPGSVPPDGTTSVTVEYRLPLTDNSSLAAISPNGSLFLPMSFWYPAPNTPFALRGPDVAPFNLKVDGEWAVSSGVEKKPRNLASVYTQSLNAQPFFVTGDWEKTEGAGEASGVSTWLQRGSGAEERKEAEALMNLAGAARSFYAGLLGPAPEAPINIVSVTRGAGFNDAGTVLLDSAVFRRTRIDSTTALLVAESVARLWVGGQTAVRGEGFGVIREGLTRYLANLFLEKQFGRETADAERMRQRIAYVAVSKRDAPLSLATPLDDTYFGSVANKGAMVWRVLERALGRDAFHAIVRAALQNAKGSAQGLTLAALRAALVERGGASVKTVLDQELDQPTDMDLLIGVPQQRGAQWVSALRNTGSVDASVMVAATTVSGDRLTVETIVPARNFAEAVFNTQARIARVEIDPDKLYPQLDYSNDIAPRTRQSDDALSEATRLYTGGQFAQAETIAREQLSIAPRMQEARIMLARSLLAENKLDEAEKEFRQALDERAPTPSTLAWANIGLGEVALRKGQAAEAARRFDEAVRVDAEYASTIAARAGRINAEAKASAAPALDESVKAFIAQFDTAIKTGKKTELESLIVPGELSRFVQGIVGSQPEVWQTRILRTEQLDANRMAVDVSLNTREFGRDQAGTAVLMLARAGGGWKLSAIEFFEVR